MKCDVCGGKKRDDELRTVQVWDMSKDVLEKNLEVCHKCLLELNFSRLLTKKERDWIMCEIIVELSSTHKYIADKNLWNREQHILEKAQDTLKIPKEAWGWRYDMPKKEFELLKVLYEKIQTREVSP